MKHILVWIGCMWLLTTQMQAQLAVGGAITSGATNTLQQSGYSAQGAVGQPIVGITGNTPYVSSGIISHGNAVQKFYESTLIRIDSVVQQIGDTFALDVAFGASCSLFQSGVVSRDWELKVSFNRTVLEPLRYDSIIDDGERYTITVSGSAASNSGVITKLLFMGRLGNDSTTDVRIESFRWKEVQRQFIQSLAGAVTLRGLCNTYGNTRLLKNPAVMSILIAPNPVTGSSFAVRTYSERPQTGTLVVTDIHGNVVYSSQGVEAGSNWPLTTVELQVIPAGSYTVALYTDNDVVRTTMVKLP